MKRISESHKWRTPSVVDKHPELLELLRTNPPYSEARALRRILLRKRQWAVEAAERRSLHGFIERPELDLLGEHPTPPHCPRSRRMHLVCAD
jgi:hypothetical protein